MLKIGIDQQNLMDGEEIAQRKNFVRGSLIWLLKTRVDIAFAVGVLIL